MNANKETMQAAKDLKDMREALSEALAALRTAYTFHNHMTYPAIGKKLERAVKRIQAMGIEEL